MWLLWEPMMAACLIGLGANLDDPQGRFDAAIDQLELASGVHVAAISRTIQTRPIGRPGQDDYFNAAALLQTSLSPTQLLQTLLQVEDRLGRKRTEHWGSRLIDLDLLLYEDQITYGPQLMVPHPWLLVRRFALGPAVELLPEAVHPLVRRSLKELLSALSGPQVSLCGADADRRQEIAIAAVSHLQSITKQGVSLLVDPQPWLPEGAESRERTAAVLHADNQRLVSPFLVSNLPPAAIVLLDSPADVYAGRPNSIAQWAMKLGRPMLILSPDQPVAQAAEQVAMACLAREPLTDLQTP